MKIKSFMSAVILLLAGTFTLSGQVKSTTDVILSSYTARNFTSDPVSDSDLNTILRCGIKAPSAMNSQPWKFTVVRDRALLTSIMPNIAAGTLLIVVSGQDANRPGMNPTFDCALATENMYVAAQGLGLGAHIYMSPVAGLNARKQELGIPDGYNVITVLQIGHVGTGVDAVSAASVRNSLENVVNYK